MINFKLLRVLAAIPAALLLLIFSNENFAQEKSENSTLVASSHPGSIESPNGYWLFSGTNTQVSGSPPQCNWKGQPGDLSVVIKWKDGLDILHTISCKYQWQAPPSQLQPGSEVRLTGTYINTEYSTTTKVNSGLNIIMDKLKKEDMSEEMTEIVKISRDNKNYENETKLGLAQAPRTGSKDTELKFFINCYAGSSSYLTTYTYTWISTGD